MSVDNFHFSPVSGVSLIFFILLSLAGALQLQLLTTLLLTHSKQVLRFLQCTVHKWIHPMNLINFLFSKLLELESYYLMYIGFYIFVDLLFLFVSMSGQFPETVLKLFHNFTLSLKFKTLIECS